MIYSLCTEIMLYIQRTSVTSTPSRSSKNVPEVEPNQRYLFFHSITWNENDRNQTQ